MSWLRVRFKTSGEDYRPVKFPPPGPYWCSGYTGDGELSICVAYLRAKKQLKEFWPDATDVEDFGPCNSITFTDRFPKPKWFVEEMEA